MIPILIHPKFDQKGWEATKTKNLNLFNDSITVYLAFNPIALKLHRVLAILSALG